MCMFDDVHFCLINVDPSITFINDPLVKAGVQFGNGRIGSVRVLQHSPPALQRKLPPLRTLRRMEFASLKKSQVAVDPNEYTFGKDGILTLLPLSGVRQLQHSRHLFKAWVLDKVTWPRGVLHLGPGAEGSGVGEYLTPRPVTK